MNIDSINNPNVKKLIKNDIFKKSFWTSFRLWVLTFIIVFTILFFFSFLFRNIQYKPVCNNLSISDSRMVTTQLLKMHIPYTIVSGQLLVPENKVNDVRLLLLEKGLPKENTVGFELLDKESFGISQFNEKINYQRALEGELSQLIQRLNYIRTAKVHIVFSKDSTFICDQGKIIPSASVIVSLQDGKILKFSQAKAISYLLSASIPELLPQNVVILDDHGTLLNDFINDKNINTVLHSDSMKEIENDYQQRIEYILEPLIKLSDIHISVIVENNHNHEIEQHDSTCIVNHDIDDINAKKIISNNNTDNTVLNSKNHVLKNYISRDNMFYKLSVLVLINYVHNEQGVYVPLSIDKITQIKSIIKTVIHCTDEECNNQISIFNVPFLSHHADNSIHYTNILPMNKKIFYYIFHKQFLFFVIGFVIILWLLKKWYISNIKITKLNQKSYNTKNIFESPIRDINNDDLQTSNKNTLRENVSKISQKNPKLIAKIIKNWINNKI